MPGPFRIIDEEGGQVSQSAFSFVKPYEFFSP